jgi:hypothetical protein
MYVDLEGHAELRLEICYLTKVFGQNCKSFFTTNPVVLMLQSAWGNVHGVMCTVYV